MAQRGEDITTKFKVDISDLKAGISEANKQIKLANAEFKAASAGMDDWQKSSDGVNAKLKQLDTVLGNEIKKLQSYEDQLQKIEEASKENEKRANELKTKLQQLAAQGVSKTSAEYKKYEKALNDVEKEQLANQSAADKLKITVLNQQAVVNKTEKEIRDYTKALTDLENEADQAGNATEDLNDNLRNTDGATNEANGGFTILKGTLANLTANVISNAISKIGELASSLFDMVEATEEYRSMMAKLSGSSETYGYSTEFAKEQFKEFYKYLGDNQMATNAITNLMGIATSTDTLTRIAEGATAVWATYGDSIPIESLTEAINETINVGKVTGTFADTINWAGLTNQQFASILGDGTKAQAAFNQSIKDGEAQEDAFSAALAATSDQGERANIVANFLNDVYGSSKVIYDDLNGAMLNANESELDLIDSQAKLAEVVSPVKDVFTQLKTQALEAILPIVSDLAQKFLDLKAYLEEHPAVAAAVTTAVTALAAAFGVLAGALAIQALIKGVTAAIALLNTTLLANPIVLIVAAIAALVAAFVTLWNKSEAFRNFWIGLWDGIKNVISTVVDWIKDNWQTMILFLMNPIAGLFKYFYDNFEGFRNFVDGFVQSIKDFFTDMWEGIKNIFSNIADWFSDIFTGAKDAITSSFSTVADWFSDNVVEPIKKFFQPLVDWFTQLFTSIRDFIKSVFEVVGQLAQGCVILIQTIWGVIAEWFNTNVIQPVQQFFTALWEAIKKAAQVAWNFIVSVWTAVSSWFNNKVITPVKKFFTNLWNTISTAASTAWNKITEIWEVVSSWFNDTVIQPVKDFFTDMWDGVKKGASDAWEGIKSVFSKVASFFGDIFSTAWNKVKSVFSTGGKIFDGIKDGIVSAFKNIVNAIIKGINKVVSVPFNAINDILEKLRNVDIFGQKPFKGLISTISVPQIPLLQKGGVLKKGQLGLLEGNGAEAVVPLDKNKLWIKRVADDMRRELQSGMPSNLASNLQNNNVNNFTQIINAPKSPSRIEIYRDTKNLLALKGGY